MTKDEAYARVRAELDRKLVGWGRLPEDFVIVDVSTREFPWGWVFFYNSRRFIETRDPLDALGGNAPFIVNRNTGEVRVTGTAHSIEHYIREYEASLIQAQRAVCQVVPSSRAEAEVARLLALAS